MDASPSRDNVPSGKEYFELNKDEPGAVLSTKNHKGGLDGTEDHADGKIFLSLLFVKMTTSDD